MGEFERNALLPFTRELNSNFSMLFFSIVIPFGNSKDLEDIPKDLKKDVHFYPVKTIREVLTIAFPTVLDKLPPKL